MNTDKNVYILGAGFSKELGLPLQDEFLLSAREVFFRDPNRYNHFEEVFKYQDRLSKMRKFLNYPLWNLEQLFNLIEMDIFYSSSLAVSEIKNDFVKLINDTILELTPNPFYHDRDGKLKTDGSIYARYLDFLSLFYRSDKNNNYAIIPCNDTIISFNYDLAIETAACIHNWNKSNVLSRQNFSSKANYFMKLNILFGKENINVRTIEDIFNEKRDRKFFPSFEDIFSDSDSSIKLIKLHGSINWISVENNKTFIVPPSWNKSDPQIRKLWDMAYKELKEAQRIIVIGYSFPETDIYVKSLLALALNENRILQNIYFVNPDKDIVKKACLSLLDKHFEKYCEYKEWTFSKFIRSEEGSLFIRNNLNRL